MWKCVGNWEWNGDVWTGWCLGRWWSVVVVQHRFQAACKVVGKRARIVFSVRHKCGNAEQQQHQRLDGQRSAKNASHETVAAGKHSGVYGFGIVGAISIWSTNTTK